MTTNSHWPEIQRELLPGEKWENRPDLVSRVYRMKLLMLLDLIQNKNVFGQPAVVVGVTEYQKCSLPHCHILVCLEQKLDTPAQYDSVVCAELPCEVDAPELNALVLKHMIHKPCTTDTLCACRKGAEDDRGVAPTTACQKHFPKEHRITTGIADDVDAYPQYRRREPVAVLRANIDSCWHDVTEAPDHTDDTPKFQYKAQNGQQTGVPANRVAKHTRGVGVTPKKTRVTNQWVVPYNPALLMLLNCHVNVEVTSSINCVKYLFKYVYKGNDRIIYKLREALSAGGEENKVQEYRAARILTGCESYFCIRFPNQRFYMWPKVIALEVHTEETMPVHIKEGDLDHDGDMADAIDAALEDPTRTKLTQYMAYCAAHRDGRCSGYCAATEACREPNADAPSIRCNELTYEQFPRHYRWCGPKGGWVRRVNASHQYGRMHRVPLKTGEPYYARVLLTKVKGATCFNDLKKMPDGTTAASYRDACYAARDEGSYITDDDSYWHDVLDQAGASCKPDGARSTPDELLLESQLIDSQRQYRHMFVMVLQHGMPAHPSALFEKHKTAMAADYARKHHLRADSAEIQKHLIGELHRIMDLSDFGDDDRRPIPARPDQTWIADQAHQRDVQDAARRLQAANERIDTDDEQAHAYDRITKCIFRKEPTLLWLNAIAGAGKTTVVNAILDYCVVNGHTAVATATTGIAAELLHRATTFHSATGAPLKPPKHAREFGFGIESRIAAVLRPADVIIVDEATMLHHVLLDSLDLTLRSLEPRDSPKSKLSFAGKVILLAGDYQQQLPVVRQGNELDVQEATLINAACWHARVKLRLSTNHRMRCPAPSDSDTAKTKKLRGDTEQYQQFCDRVGQGTEPAVPGTERTVRLPAALRLDCTGADTRAAQIECMVDHIYGGAPSEKDHPEWITSRRIVTPKNVDVAEINDVAMRRFKGRSWTSRSTDTMEPGEQTSRSAVPEKVMNGYKPPGMPPHELKLQVGIPYQLIRNYDKGLGLCNGTVVILTGFDCNCTENSTECCHCRVNCVSVTVPGSRHFRRNQEIRIPRIIFLPDEDDYCPFMFRRRQFPLMPCLASTIMKSQGQSLQSTVVYLPSPCFTHGQLYVAITRTESAGGVKVLALDLNGKQVFETENVVNPVIIQNIEQGDSDVGTSGTSDARTAAPPRVPSVLRPTRKPKGTGERASKPKAPPKRKTATNGRRGPGGRPPSGGLKAPAIRKTPTHGRNPKGPGGRAPSGRLKAPAKRKAPAHPPASVSDPPQVRAAPATLASFMATMGRQRAAATGDGHCGFRAMAMQQTANTGSTCTVDDYYDAMIAFASATHFCARTRSSIQQYERVAGLTLAAELKAGQADLRAGKPLADGWYSYPDHAHWSASITGNPVLVLAPTNWNGHASGVEPTATASTEYTCLAYYATPGDITALTPGEAARSARQGAAVLVHNGRPGTAARGALYTDVGHFDSLVTPTAALQYAGPWGMDNAMRIRGPAPLSPTAPSAPVSSPTPAVPAPLPARALSPPIGSALGTGPKCPLCSEVMSVSVSAFGGMNSSKYGRERYCCSVCCPQTQPLMYARCAACNEPVRARKDAQQYHTRSSCIVHPLSAGGGAACEARPRARTPRGGSEHLESGPLATDERHQQGLNNIIADDLGPKCPLCSEVMSVSVSAFGGMNSSKYGRERYCCSVCCPQTPPLTYARCAACNEPVRARKDAQKYHTRSSCVGHPPPAGGGAACEARPPRARTPRDSPVLSLSAGAAFASAHDADWELYPHECWYGLRVADADGLDYQEHREQVSRTTDERQQQDLDNIIADDLGGQCQRQLELPFDDYLSEEDDDPHTRVLADILSGVFESDGHYDDVVAFAHHARASAMAGESDSAHAHDNEDTYAEGDAAPRTPDHAGLFDMDARNSDGDDESNDIAAYWQ
jgi:hypothetical protein